MTGPSVENIEEKKMTKSPCAASKKEPNDVDFGRVQTYL